MQKFQFKNNVETKSTKGGFQFQLLDESGKKLIKINLNNTLDTDWYFSFSYCGKSIKKRRFTKNDGTIIDLNILCGDEKIQFCTNIIDTIFTAYLCDISVFEKIIEYIPIQKQKVYTLTECIDEYITFIGSYMADVSVKSYVCKLKVFSKQYCTMSINDFLNISKNDIEFFLNNYEYEKLNRVSKNEIKKTLIKWSPSAKNFAKTSMAQMIEWLKNDSKYGIKTDRNIFKEIKKTKVATTQKNIAFSIDDNTKLNQYLEANKSKWIVFYSSLLIEKYHHLRPSLISQIKLSDIDMINGILYTSNDSEKNKLNNKIQLHQDIIDIIHDYVPADMINTDNFLLANKNGFTVMGGGKMIGKEYMGKTAKVIYNYANIDNKYTFYSGKHFANVMKMRHGGMSVADLAVVNHHQDIKQTEHYLKSIRFENNGVVNSIEIIDKLKAMGVA